MFRFYFPCLFTGGIILELVSRMAGSATTFGRRPIPKVLFSKLVFIVFIIYADLNFFLHLFNQFVFCLIYQLLMNFKHMFN